MKSEVTLPTLITLSRMVLTPVVVHYIVSQAWISALIVLLIAWLTDFADGFIARYYDQESQLGSYLDPIADKLLLLGTYGALLQSVGVHWFFMKSATNSLYGDGHAMVRFVTYALVLRETFIVIGALVVLACFRTPRLVLQPMTLGKITTLLHALFLLLLCTVYGGGWGLSLIMPLGSAVVVCMTISTGQYCWRFFENWGVG